jgi:hypothetical protein
MPLPSARARGEQEIVNVQLSFAVALRASFLEMAPKAHPPMTNDS